MSTPEGVIQAEIRLAIGREATVRAFRNNSGVLYDRTGQPVRFGVGHPGGSDLICMKQVVITPDHVGRTLAVFAAVEVKSPTGKLTPEQQRFLDFVTGFGGIAGVVRSPDDARRLFGL